MTTMTEEVLAFNEVKERLQCEDTAAALLVLSRAIRASSTFNATNAKNFENALSKVLEQSRVRVTDR